MSEIVYYDENPTVRALMVKTLARFGFDIVQMPSLNQCEDTLRNCKNPIALIMDLSRYPEKLPRMQAIVPNYMPNPEQCILTSTKPTALANFLPDKIEDCFFKHIVERPFKRLDFAQFVENIIQPFLPAGRTFDHSHSISMSLLNSSVSQITGQVTQGPFDEDLKKQVDSIINSSRSIALNKVEAMASSDSSSLMQNKSGSYPMQHRSKVTVLDVLESQSDNPAIKEEESTEFPSPGEHKIPGLRESVISDPSHISIVRPIPVATINMSLLHFLDILKITAIHNSKFTLVCHESSLAHVIIVEAGRVQWFESLQYDTIPDETMFFTNTPYANILPVQEILSLMRQNLSMSAAISALDADDLSIEFCEHSIREATARIYALEGRITDVYQDVPSPYNTLLLKRPIQGIDVIPFLFELCRKNEDAVIVPDIFRFANFTMRPYRTPMNRMVQLNQEESDLLIAIQSPRTLNDLKRARIKGVADLLYRLVIFEFADLVG